MNYSYKSAEHQNEDARIESTSGHSNGNDVQVTASVAPNHQLISQKNLANEMLDEYAPKRANIVPQTIRDQFDVEVISSLDSQVHIGASSQSVICGTEACEESTRTLATGDIIGAKSEKKGQEAMVVKNFHENATATSFETPGVAKCMFDLTVSLLSGTASSDLTKEKHQELAKPPSQFEATEEELPDDVALLPVTYMDSLTASFAPETKAIWAQIFGPRFGDDKNEKEYYQEDNQSITDRTRSSDDSTSALQAKLARERKLDQHIQASQRRHQARIVRAAALKEVAAKRVRVVRGKRFQKQALVPSPFEKVGLSLTQIRLCTKKALGEMCKSFRQLHAAIFEEAEYFKEPLHQGIYITKRELELLFCEVFDFQDLKFSNTNNYKQTIATPLDFEGGEYVEGITMNDHLQASWFLPFRQLSRLRSLIMRITRRHLDEEKLVIVDRNLQEQLTLMPLSAKLQTAIVHLSNCQLEGDQKLNYEVGTFSEAVHELLNCIAVKEATILTENCNNFRSISLVELMAKSKLSSIVCIQRLVFFRYFINNLSTERMRLQIEPMKPIKPPPKQNIRARQKSAKGDSLSTKLTLKSTPEANDSRDDEITLDQREDGELLGISDVLAKSYFNKLQEQTGDQCESQDSKLQQQLEKAITSLRQILYSNQRNIDQKSALDPAIQATYLAAVACHDSVRLLLDNNFVVDAAMRDKLLHFLKASQNVQRTEVIANTDTMASSLNLELERHKHHLHDSSELLPSYPEGSESDEVGSKTDSNTKQLQYPPPYSKTSPSWISTPLILELKAGFSKKMSSTQIAELSSDNISTKSQDTNRSKSLCSQSQPYNFVEDSESSKSSDILSSVSRTDKQKSSSRRNYQTETQKSDAFMPFKLLFNEHKTVSIPTATNSGLHHENCVDSGWKDEYLCDPPSYFSQMKTDEIATNNSDTIAIDRALQLQHRICMNDFVHQVVSNQEGRTNDANSTKHPKSEPYWLTCEVSPGINRLLHRQRRPSGFLKSRRMSATTRPQHYVHKTFESSPPLRQLDNDQHLAWAARISDLYQPAYED